MFILVVILLAIGVLGKQPHKYYFHALIAVGVFMVLLPLSLWVNVAMIDVPSWWFFGFLSSGLAYAIPIVIVAAGYERKAIPRLIPLKKTSQADAPKE